MMKNTIMLFFAVFMLLFPSRGFSQSQEIQQLLLNIEKLAQFKEILKDMKKGYEILTGGYKAVKNMSEGNFTLHKTFIDALMQVSPVVKNYKKAGDIINYQILLIKETKMALKRFTKSENFTAAEIKYFETVYRRLTQESLRNLDDLTIVLTADKLRMSDDERLEAIDKIYLEMQDKVLFLRKFNSSSSILNLQRAKEADDVKIQQEFYSLKN